MWRVEPLASSVTVALSMYSGATTTVPMAIWVEWESTLLQII